MTTQGEKGKHGKEEAWIAQARNTTLDIGENGSSARWVGASLPWHDLPVFPGPGATMNLALMADLSWLIVCVYSVLETVRARRWSDHAEELEREDYRIVALSAQTPEAQHEWASSAELAYSVVSDSDLQFAQHLGLPTFEVGEGIRAYEDLTLIIDGTTARIFYPLEHPKGDDAARVMNLIRRVHADR